MKHINKWPVIAFILLATACEKDLPVFEDSECLLNFNYGSEMSTSAVREPMRIGSYSFKLKAEEDQLVDTVWLDIDLMGKLSDEPRPLPLRQVMLADTANAVAGMHYVAFDDPGMASWYVLPANQAKTRIPVVVKRDPSLEAEGDVVLRITFGENDYFKAGYPEFSVYTLTISDQLTKPSLWDRAYFDSYFGKYGSKKHELMIQWTEQNWDDDYIMSLLTEWYGYLIPKDSNYIEYLAKWFALKLEEENAERLKNGEDIYREKSDNAEQPGAAVDFTPIED